MKVSELDWKKANENLTLWRKNRKSAPNFSLYRDIVSKVNIGYTVLDVGAGQCYLKEVLPENKKYYPIDPFPLDSSILKYSAEDLNDWTDKFDTVFMMSALDNVMDLELSLKGLKKVAKQNVVILTGIDIEPDINHTVKVTRESLVKILGKPKLEVEVSAKVFLFDFRI